MLKPAVLLFDCVLKSRLLVYETLVLVILEVFATPKVTVLLLGMMVVVDRDTQQWDQQEVRVELIVKYGG